MSWKQKQKRITERKPAEITLNVTTDDGDAEDALSAAQERARVAGASAIFDIARRPREEGETFDREAELAAHPDVVAAQAEVDAAQAAYRDTVIDITFRALAPDAFDALVAQHPPIPGTDDEGALFHGDTLWPALMAACHVDYDTTPDGERVEQEDGMTVEDAQELLTAESTNSADRDRLIAAAWSVNTATRTSYGALGKG